MAEDRASTRGITPSTLLSLQAAEPSGTGEGGHGHVVRDRVELLFFSQMGGGYRLSFGRIDLAVDDTEVQGSRWIELLP